MGIGVSEFIQIPEVRRKIDSEYDNPGEDAKSDSIVTHDSYSHQLIGVAFDYLSQFWVAHNCDDVVLPTGNGSHHTGFNRHLHTPSLKGIPPSDGERKRFQPEWRHGANKQIAQFVQTGLGENQIVESSLMMAGWIINDVQTPDGLDKSAFNSDLVNDLREMFSSLKQQDWTGGECAYLRPDFGARSHILEGEGDFIVDGKLVDIKTTHDKKFNREYWRQLVSYKILSDVNRLLKEEKEEPDESYPEVTQAGIYFARRGEMSIINLSEVIQDKSQYKKFRAWFVDRAIEENLHAGRNYGQIREILTEPYEFQRQQSLADF